MRNIAVFIHLFFLMLCSIAYASPYAPAGVKIQVLNEKLIIKNETQQIINLKDSILQFYYAGDTAILRGSDQLKLRTSTQIEYFTHKPNSSGNQYQITFNEIQKPFLLPAQSLTLELMSDKKGVPHGFVLLAVDRVPVQVKVTTSFSGGVQTVTVCNDSGYDIPLTDVEFDFNYGQKMPKDIWGSPWTDWHLASQDGTKVVLLGGTPWTTPLLSDPNCSHPMTIKWSASKADPAPTGPFVFKSAGGHPSEMGTLNVIMPAAPVTGLATPQVTVSGTSINKTESVNWGSKWQISDLVPGTYTVTASPVDNGKDFYSANPITADVKNKTTTNVTVMYKADVTGDVTVTFVNAPQLQEPVTFTGKNSTYKKILSSGTKITLPADTYSVSSLVPGYSAVPNPNPLVVPNNTTLSITYEKQSILNPRFVGYFQSWNSDKQTHDGTKTNLANMPSYMNFVILSFMKPDATYTKGTLNYSGTGLEFNYETGGVLKESIATLHQKNPETKVLVAVGGATYLNWDNLNAKAIADFVSDFGLDGVDIDYEPSSTGCAMGPDNLIHCTIDDAYQSFVQSLRSMLPRPYMITVAAWSIGAYGQDQWKNATPQSQFTGMMLPLLRSVAGLQLDMVNAMSYDAGNTYDPKQALAAYTNYYKGPVAMGVEVPPEGWGGHVYTLKEVEDLTQTVVSTAASQNRPPSMMLWSIQKQPNGTPSDTNPSAQMMATNICKNLGLKDCDKPLLINGFTELFSRYFK